MADDLEDAKKEINRIKKSSQYIYSEVTAPDAQGAKDMAEEILFSEINEWVTKQKKLRNSPNIVINNRKELWTSVELPRGNMIRAFLYVKKSDIIPAENTEVIENTSKIEEIKSEVNFTMQLPEDGAGNHKMHTLFRHGFHDYRYETTGKNSALWPLFLLAESQRLLSGNLQ